VDTDFAGTTSWCGIIANSDAATLIGARRALLNRIGISRFRRKWARGFLGILKEPQVSARSWTNGPARFAPERLNYAAAVMNSQRSCPCLANSQSVDTNMGVSPRSALLRTSHQDDRTIPRRSTSASVGVVETVERSLPYHGDGCHAGTDKTSRTCAMQFLLRVRRRSPHRVAVALRRRMTTDRPCESSQQPKVGARLCSQAPVSPKGRQATILKSAGGSDRRAHPAPSSAGAGCPSRLSGRFFGLPVDWRVDTCQLTSEVPRRSTRTGSTGYAHFDRGAKRFPDAGPLRGYVAGAATASA
jgi:hypothetical protein